MILRNASLEEVAVALEWAADEGWNPGLDDAAAFWAADTQGFFVAEMQGQPVAFLSVVNHDADHAFLGLYLCLLEWRGKGIGLALWTHAIQHAGGRSIGLDGVPAQQANYARSGFLRTGCTRRWEGHLSPQTYAAIRSVRPTDMQLILAMDTAANGYRRDAFLGSWTVASPTRRSVMFSDGSGFATARACRYGVKLGPLVTPNAAAALQLMRAALIDMQGDWIMIDLPETNRALADTLAKIGFTPGFATARMAKGKPPQPRSNLQAIATMELG